MIVELILYISLYILFFYECLIALNFSKLKIDNVNCVSSLSLICLGTAQNFLK